MRSDSDGDGGQYVQITQLDQSQYDNNEYNEPSELRIGAWSRSSRDGYSESVAPS